MRFFVSMKLTVNGEHFETSTAGTVKGLLEELKIKPERVAVEVNMTIVKKSDYATFRLHAGDTVEIVNFIGGG
jgi:sulfur carrier protein